MALVQLHSHVVAVTIVQQDAIAFSRGDLPERGVGAHIPGADPQCHPSMSPCPPSPHLKGDIGPGPVLQVSELQVRVPVHKVDAQQLLTFGATKARQALAQGTGAPLDTRGPVLAFSSLTEARLARGVGRHLAELATVGPRVLLGRELGKSPTPCPMPHGTLTARP